jgi:hypothetical protein
MKEKAKYIKTIESLIINAVETQYWSVQDENIKND